ncbi:MAG: NAD-dependent deacetylase [Candidatus Latescibacteria bacterium]|jgi:NAD-dependent deacetylase|nr:NAD-dependent deacetylase [Candidatus Latescibacterota bacterium]MBT4140075.1 NAD-dependent deacetylase [Candidatus Latescibacterota bacterium]
MSEQLTTLIKNANRILIFTGAGISTASGIRDFRGPNGVWKTRQPVYYQDFMASEKARIEAWDQKLESWEAFKNARPNDTHRAIVDLEIAERIECVVTQNIDGLHAKAGTSSDRLVEVHGTNTEAECQTCGERSAPDPHYISFMATGKPPICPCGGYLKTATISFGQNLHEEELHRATLAANNADLVIALGSTLSVYPAATFPLLAAEQGAPYVIINQGETDHDDYDTVTLRLEGNVNEIFPQAVALALEKSTDS